MLSHDQQLYIEEKYANASQKTQNVATMYLERMAINEYDWHNDFTLQSSDVLQKAFNSIGASRYEHAKAQLSELVSYANWRKTKGLPCGDAIFHLEIDTSLSIRNCMVSSPEHLETVLNAFFDTNNLATIDLVYRVFFWAAFMGLEDFEAVRITSDDVDLDRKIIKVGDKQFVIYQNAVQDFRKAATATEFYEATRSGSRGPFKKFTRTCGNLIMRGKAVFGSTPQDLDALRSTIRSRLSRVKKSIREREFEKYPDIPFDLTYQKTYLSGIYYRMYCEERWGQAPDFTALATTDVEKREADGKPYKTTKTFTRQTIINRLARNYELNYKSWKKAFYEN